MSAPSPAWAPPPTAFVLRPGEVHVFSWRLSLSAQERSRDEAVLSETERARAQRLRSDILQERFIAGRGMLRRLLGRYLGRPPREVDLVVTSSGKPALIGGQSLCFNLSHSEDRALMALALDRRIGADLERVRADVAVLDLARRFFSERERDELSSLPPASRARAFFACWTRKEALVKARGDGLGLRLDAFDVTVRPDEPPRVRRTAWDPGDAERFALLDLPRIPGFAAALAVEGGLTQLRCFAIRPGSAGKV